MPSIFSAVKGSGRPRRLSDSGSGGGGGGIKRRKSVSSVRRPPTPKHSSSTLSFRDSGPRQDWGVLPKIPPTTPASQALTPGGGGFGAGNLLLHAFSNIDDEAPLPESDGESDATQPLSHSESSSEGSVEDEGDNDTTPDNSTTTATAHVGTRGSGPSPRAATDKTKKKTPFAEGDGVVDEASRRRRSSLRGGAPLLPVAPRKLLAAVRRYGARAGRGALREEHACKLLKLRKAVAKFMKGYRNAHVASGAVQSDVDGGVGTCPAFSVVVGLVSCSGWLKSEYQARPP